MCSYLTLNKKKSHFFRKDTKFLGFILTTEGIKPDPEKISSIQDSPAPRNIKQWRGFLGLINFYSKLSDKHAAERVPLLKLIEEGATCDWNKEAENSFEGVKKLFGNSIML